MGPYTYLVWFAVGALLYAAFVWIVFVRSEQQHHDATTEDGSEVLDERSSLLIVHDRVRHLTRTKWKAMLRGRLEVVHEDHDEATLRHDLLKRAAVHREQLQ